MEMGMATTAADRPSLAKYSNGEMGNGKWEGDHSCFLEKGPCGGKISPLGLGYMYVPSSEQPVRLTHDPFLFIFHCNGVKMIKVARTA